MELERAGTEEGEVVLELSGRRRKEKERAEVGGGRGSGRERDGNKLGHVTRRARRTDLIGFQWVHGAATGATRSSSAQSWKI
jgi:hypothetical protein